MLILKLFKTDVGLISFTINMIVYFFIASVFYLIYFYFNFNIPPWGYIVILFVLFSFFSIVTANLNYQFIKNKLINLCNIISKSSFEQIDKVFPYDIYEVVNIELNYLTGSLKEKFDKEKKQIEYFEKNFIKVMENIDKVNYGTKKLTRKIKDAFNVLDRNGEYINKLKERSSRFREQITNIKSEKYNYKIIVDEITNINKKLSNTHKKIDILVKNIFSSKQGEEENFNLIENIKIKIKTFFDIIESIDLIAVNTSIEAARLDEGQTFLMFAKDLQLSVSKFNKEISDISDVLQKFQLKQSDMDNFLYAIRELKEEYKSYNIFIENINDFFDFFKKHEVYQKEVLEDLIKKNDDIDDYLKEIDFHSVKVFKTNIEMINENMDTLDDIYTFVQDIKKKIVTYI